MTPGDHYLDNLDADPSAAQPKAMTAEQMQARIVRWLRNESTRTTRRARAWIENGTIDQGSEAHRHIEGQSIALLCASVDIEWGEHMKGGDHE